MFEVEFVTAGGAPFNFQNISKLFPKEFSLLSYVNQLGTAEKPTQVKLRVQLTKKKLKDMKKNSATAKRLDDWFRRLPGGSESFKIFGFSYTYPAYRKSKGESRINWRDFIKRYQLILKDVSMILASLIEMFSDPREAEIVLGYGSCLAYQEDILVLKQFCIDSK